MSNGDSTVAVISAMTTIVVFAMVMKLITIMSEGMFGSTKYLPAVAASDKARLEDKYGTWAVGLAETFCSEGDLKCVEDRAKKLHEAVTREPWGPGQYQASLLYPEEEKWTRMAEDIVRKRPDVNPEYIGHLLADATSPIIAWDRESREKQLSTRRNARVELRTYAREAGIIGRWPEEQT